MKYTFAWVIFTFCVFGFVNDCVASDEPDRQPANVTPGDSQVSDFPVEFEGFETDESMEEFQTDVRTVAHFATDDTTIAAETIQVAQYTKTVRTVSELVGTAVGVQVRTTGGFGSFGLAQIRGASAAQVSIFLDGVMLNSGGFSSVDLGSLNLNNFESIELYRGQTPLALGFGSIGGAISLKTRTSTQPSSQFALSIGSGEARRMLAFHSSMAGKVHVLAALTVESAKGDFDYLNRNGTPLNNDDDRIMPRQNNAHQAHSSLVKLSTNIGSWKLSLLNELLVKDNGLAGIDSVPTQHASLHQLRELVGGFASGRLGSRLEIQTGMNLLLLRMKFSDPNGEIGVGHQSSINKARAVNGYVSGKIRVADAHRIDFRVQGTHDWFLMRDLLGSLSKKGVPSTRNRYGIGLEHQWQVFDAFKWVTSLRCQGYHSHKTYSDSVGGQQNETTAVNSSEFFMLPGAGFKWQLSKRFTYQGNMGKYVRSPDLFELYGDHGATVGNADLVSEEGINADLGMNYRVEGVPGIRFVRMYTGVFGAWSDDLIAYVQNSQNTVRAENVDSARALGIEVSGTLALAWGLKLDGNYTYLETVNRSEKPYHQGRQLPGRPAHEAYARLAFERSFQRWAGGIWTDVDYAGGNYLDQANLKEDVLARALLGAGLRIELPHLGLTGSLDVKNVLNTIVLHDENGNKRPVRDFEAYPLPGRTFFFTIHWNV